MNVFGSIMTGLNEAVVYEKGEGKVRTVQLTVAPVPDFTAEEIKALQQTLKMTQGTFAALMGVSSKTVEAWEVDTCRNLNPQGSDNGRCFVIITFTMRFYGCSIRISK